MYLRDHWKMLLLILSKFELFNYFLFSLKSKINDFLMISWGIKVNFSIFLIVANFLKEVKFGNDPLEVIHLVQIFQNN